MNKKYIFIGLGVVAVSVAGYFIYKAVTKEDTTIPPATAPTTPSTTSEAEALLKKFLALSASYAMEKDVNKKAKIQADIKNLKEALLVIGFEIIDGKLTAKK